MKLEISKNNPIVSFLAKFRNTVTSVLNPIVNFFKIPAVKSWIKFLPFILVEAIISVSIGVCVNSAFGTVIYLGSLVSFTALALSIFAPIKRCRLVWSFNVVSHGFLILSVFLHSQSTPFTLSEFISLFVSVITLCVVIILLIGKKPTLFENRLIRVCISACAFIEIFLHFTHHRTSFGEYDVLLLAISHAMVIGAMGIFAIKKIHVVFKIVYLLPVPVFTYLLLEGLTHLAWKDITLDVSLLNISVFALLLVTVLFVIGRSSVAVTLSVGVPIILGLVSYFTVAFRGTPLFPWDLASYGIAATVLGGYEINIIPKIGFIIVSSLVICILSFKLNIRLKFPFKFIRPILALAACVCVFFGGSYLQTDAVISDYGLYPYLFYPHHLYKTNGFAVSFIMNLRYTTVEKPSGYSVEELHEFLESYESDSAGEAEVKPNVIVIMNETFADMKALCEFETTAEYLPFYDSLTDGAVKGNLHASVVGGNTPNSEFEFLTGMTMGYLPAGSIPYQQFIKSERESLASQFSDMGYDTVAMHPYWADGWKRDTIYPYFGFDRMLFLNSEGDNFDGCPYLRGYVSDRGVYKKVTEIYESSENPLFLFAVTMQNHSGYGTKYSNFNPIVDVVGLENNLSLSTYFSLIRESDRALKTLIEYFEKADEPTIVLMFGDHQPNDSIANPLLRAAGKTFIDSDVEGGECRYVVPYLMWSNYGAQFEEREDVSINYLSSMLLSAAKLPMTASQKFMSDCADDFSVINCRCIMTADGKMYPVSDYTDYDKLMKYAYLQYGYLFDYGKVPKGLFALKE